MSLKRILIAVAAIVVAAIAFMVMGVIIHNLSQEKARYERNTEALMQGIEQYKVRDSLNAARVQTLELTVRDFERLRSEDAQLIKEMQVKTRNLASVNKTQAETIIRLSAIPRDTVLIRDSIKTPAVAVHCGDYWYDFEGVLARDEFTGKLRNRDSLVLVESVEYKRFLGFLWRTKQIKRKSMDVMSRNPHTTIIGVEYLQIMD